MVSKTANPANGDTLKAYEVHPGQVYRTPLGGRVEIISDDGPGKKVLKVRFPDREPQLDEDGEKREAHIQFMSRYSFADAANFDGYELVTEDGPTEDSEASEDEGEAMAGEWLETPRCPVCSRFMSRDTDGMGLPAAECSRLDCHGFMDDRELIEGGYFEPASED